MKRKQRKLENNLRTKISINIYSISQMIMQPFFFFKEQFRCEAHFTLYLRVSLTLMSHSAKKNECHCLYSIRKQEISKNHSAP